MCSVRATEKVRRKARRSVFFVHPSGFVNETQQSILCFSACFQSSICQVRRQELVKCQLNSLSWKILENQPQTLHGKHTNWKINLIFSLFKGIRISLIAVRHGHSFSNLFTFHYGSPFTIDPQTCQVTESFRGFHAFFSWMKSSKHALTSTYYWHTWTSNTFSPWCRWRLSLTFTCYHAEMTMSLKHSPPPEVLVVEELPHPIFASMQPLVQAVRRRLASGGVTRTGGRPTAHQESEWEGGGTLGEGKGQWNDLTGSPVLEWRSTLSFCVHSAV